MLQTLLALGLANWIATTILVDSEFTRPLREWAEDLAIRAYDSDRWRLGQVLDKVRYLIGCHLCAGTWLAAALAGATGFRVAEDGAVGFVVGSLAVKAVGHITLEVTSRLSRGAA